MLGSYIGSVTAQLAEGAPCLFVTRSMLSPTYDFKIFLGKISGKPSGEVLSALNEEIHSMEVVSPKKGSVPFAYLLDLLILSNYIHVPPQTKDRRGPIPEQLKQILRGLGLLSLPRKQPHVDP